MCQYKQTRYRCTHFHQGNRVGPGALVCHKCPAVKVALEYWHLQIQYHPAEQQFGEVVPAPRACPMVRPYPANPETRATWHSHRASLYQIMRYHGVDFAERQRIEALEAQPELTSRRELPAGQPKLGPYPPRYYYFIQALREWQDRPSQQSNVEITNISRGCGRPGRRGDLFQCLQDWNFTEILMFRMRDWDVGRRINDHLPLNYFGVQHPRPSDLTREEWANTRIDVPMTDGLYQVMNRLGTFPQHPPSGGNPPRVLLPIRPPLAPPAALPVATQSQPAVAATDEPGSQDNSYPRPHRRPSSLPEEPNLEDRGSPRRTMSAVELAKSDDGDDIGKLQSSFEATNLQPAAASSVAAQTQPLLGVAGPSSTTNSPAPPAQSSSVVAGPSSATNTSAPSSRTLGPADSVEQVTAELEEFQRSEEALYGAPHPF